MSDERKPKAYYRLTISDLQFSTIRSALNMSRQYMNSPEIKDEIDDVFDYLITTARKLKKYRDPDKKGA